MGVILSDFKNFLKPPLSLSLCFSVPKMTFSKSMIVLTCSALMIGLATASFQGCPKCKVAHRRLWLCPTCAMRWRSQRTRQEVLAQADEQSRWAIARSRARTDRRDVTAPEKNTDAER